MSAVHGSSALRDADWRFLLPAPAGNRFEHLLLLGGSAELADHLRGAGVAARVSLTPAEDDPADAVVILAGVTTPVGDAIRQLRKNGAFYWEVDRRSLRTAAMTPARAKRLLRRHGIAPMSVYGVKPGFPKRQMYLPLDAPGAIRWYLNTLFRAKGLVRRLFRRAVHAVGRVPRALGAAAPCYAITAVRGALRRPAVLEQAARHGVAVGAASAPVLVAQGDYDWNRVALLLFEPAADEPHVVLKLARRPAFTDEIEREHSCLRALATTLPPPLADSVPRSSLFSWHGGPVSVQTCVGGPNLHSRAARRRPRTLDDLRLTAQWLADFHRSTATPPVSAREWLQERFDALRAEYQSAYGLTVSEHRLLDAVSRRLARLGATGLPLVRQHADFGPWNLYRDGDRIAVIDWETARLGPPLVDLLYFVTQWNFEFSGCERDAAQQRRLEQLFCGGPGDTLVTSTRAVVAEYVQQLGLPASLVGVLLVYTMLEQAVDRMRRMRRMESGGVPAREANCYVGYLDVLAEHADRLLTPPAVVTTNAADVTVAIATRRRPAQLVRCVDAILAGRVLPAEVIIVDQSEDDATAALVARQDWSRRVPVRYIRAQPRGLAASRNTAIAHASSSIIAFTDDDCVAEEGWLAAVASAFDGPDHAAVVTGRILPLGPDRPGFYATSTRDSGVRAIYRGRSLPWTVGSGGNTAVRREWLARVGGFDERLGAGTAGLAGEDTDLLYRLLRAGAIVCYEPGALVLHERKESDGHLATRPAYGFGMGAFCALSARRRDAYAVWMLGCWCVDRARRLAGGCVRWQARRVREELLMLRGAWSGLTYGARVEMPQ